MRNRIWAELTQAKFNIEFTTLYLENQRKKLRYFNIAILIFSSGGIMGWKFWNDLPLVVCVIIAAISLLRLLQPHIIMGDKQIANLDTIQKFYTEYYNKLEKLWFDNEKTSLPDQEVSDIFFTIRNTENEINVTINETLRTKPKSLVRKAKSYSDLYFKNVFNP